MTTETTETWIDILRRSPGIPLAHSVPFVISTGERRLVVEVNDEGSIRDSKGDIWTEREAGLYLRADLDDPQGFGWALRWLGSRVDGGVHYSLCRRLAADFILGIDTDTDADRIALARAIAEVSR